MRFSGCLLCDLNTTMSRFHDHYSRTSNNEKALGSRMVRSATDRMTKMDRGKDEFKGTLGTLMQVVRDEIIRS